MLSSARAYWPQPGEAWGDGAIEIVSDLSRTAPHARVDWNAALAAALPAWNAHLERSQLTWKAASERAQYDNGRNEIFFSETFYGGPFSSGAAAMTRVTLYKGVRLETDIVLNANYDWSLYRGAPAEPAVRDFRRVVLQQLGQVLGLNHPDVAGHRVIALMNLANGGLEELTADDIAGARALYNSTAGPVLVETQWGLARRTAK